MLTQDKHLSTQNLMEKLRPCMAQLVNLQAVTNGLVSQNDIQVAQLPGLPKQQATARTLAQNYLDQVGGIIGNIRDTTVAYQQAYSTYYSKLQKITSEYEEGSNKAKSAKELTEGLSLLENYIKADKPKRQLLLGNITALSSATQSITNNFVSLKKKVDATLGPDVTNAIQSQINSIFNQINEDNKTISKGVVDDIKPIFDAIVAVISTGQKGDEDSRNSEIIAASIKKIKDVDAKEKKAMEDVATQITNYKALLLKLEKDKLEYALVCSINIQIELFHKDLSKLQLAMKGYDNAWDDIMNDLTQLKEHLSDMAPEKELINQLKEAKSQWIALSTEAESFLKVGLIPAKKEYL